MRYFRKLQSFFSNNRNNTNENNTSSTEEIIDSNEDEQSIENDMNENISTIEFDASKYISALDILKNIPPPEYELPILNNTLNLEELKDNPRPEYQFSEVDRDLLRLMLTEPLSTHSIFESACRKKTARQSPIVKKEAYFTDENNTLNQNPSNIPIDIWLIVINMLKGPSMIALMFSCKTFYNLMHSNDMARTKLQEIADLKTAKKNNPFSFLKEGSLLNEGQPEQAGNGNNGFILVNYNYPGIGR